MSHREDDDGSNTVSSLLRSRGDESDTHSSPYSRDEIEMETITSGDRKQMIQNALSQLMQDAFSEASALFASAHMEGLIPRVRLDVDVDDKVVERQSSKELFEEEDTSLGFVVIQTVAPCETLEDIPTRIRMSIRDSTLSTLMQSDEHENVEHVGASGILDEEYVNRRMRVLRAQALGKQILSTAVRAEIASELYSSLETNHQAIEGVFRIVEAQLDLTIPDDRDSDAATRDGSGNSASSNSEPDTSSFLLRKKKLFEEALCAHFAARIADDSRLSSMFLLLQDLEREYMRFQRLLHIRAELRERQSEADSGTGVAIRLFLERSEHSASLKDSESYPFFRNLLENPREEVSLAIQSRINEINREAFSPNSENASTLIIQEFVEQLAEELHDLYRDQLKSFSDDELFFLVEDFIFGRIYHFALQAIEQPDEDDHFANICQRYAHATQQELHLDAQYCSDEIVPYAEAIAHLKSLYFAHSPIRKLRVILQAAQSVFRRQGELGEGAICSDDFLPVWIYVVLKANVVKMVSQLEFIRHFTAHHYLNGEMGFHFSSLEAAVEYIKTMTDDHLRRSSDANRLEFVFLSPEKRSIQAWTENTPDIFISRPSFELIGYRCLAVRSWLTEPTRLFHTVLIRTGNDEDHVQVCAFQPSPSMPTGRRTSLLELLKPDDSRFSFDTIEEGKILSSKDIDFISNPSDFIDVGRDFDRVERYLWTYLSLENTTLRSHLPDIHALLFSDQLSHRCEIEFPETLLGLSRYQFHSRSDQVFENDDPPSSSSNWKSLQIDLGVSFWSAKNMPMRMQSLDSVRESEFFANSTVRDLGDEEASPRCLGSSSPEPSSIRVDEPDSIYTEMEPTFLVIHRMYAVIRHMQRLLFRLGYGFFPPRCAGILESVTVAAMIRFQEEYLSTNGFASSSVTVLSTSVSSHSLDSFSTSFSSPGPIGNDSVHELSNSLQIQIGSPCDAGMEETEWLEPISVGILDSCTIRALQNRSRQIRLLLSCLGIQSGRSASEMFHHMQSLTGIKLSASQVESSVAAQKLSEALGMEDDLGYLIQILQTSCGLFADGIAGKKTVDTLVTIVHQISGTILVNDRAGMDLRG